MKLLLTTIAAVLVVGCGPKAPDISIHKAAYDGNIEVVKQHLAAGTDVNEKNALKRTPLHAAVWNYRKEVIELLIANGADVNAGYKNEHSKKNPMIGTIIPGAIHSGTEVIVPINMFSGTPLDLAIMRKNAVKFTKLTGGININAETANLLRKHGGKTGAELKAEAK